MIHGIDGLRRIVLKHKKKQLSIREVEKQEMAIEHLY